MMIYFPVFILLVLPALKTALKFSQALHTNNKDILNSESKNNSAPLKSFVVFVVHTIHLWLKTLCTFI